LCDAPAQNDFSSPPIPRLDKLLPWIEHIDRLGANALYLGPLFESGSHGYDTADYYHVDRRLGERATLAYLSSRLHARGIRLILDGVFNHVGRHFWAFRDVLANGPASPYCDWFHGLRFDAGNSPFGDPFVYDTWNGHASLVKLNLHNPAVRQHLFGAVEMWISEFGIDGLRLDTADCLDLDFLAALSDFCRRLRPDFWLMGEVIHGDYRRWANPEMLDSVTNYECYKGLYSSFVDQNFFEIAYAFNRQSGGEGMYRDLRLYNFVDNHDVNRIASTLTDPAHLVPLHVLLFGMPGIPSIYYGSEWGLPGVKSPTSDIPIRPALDLDALTRPGAQLPQADLPGIIARLAHLRRGSSALSGGDYTQLMVSSQQFAFARQAQNERVVVAVNSAAQPARLDISLPDNFGTVFEDLFNPGENFSPRNGRLDVSIPPCWGRILRANPASA
jgi:glycosidase